MKGRVFLLFGCTVLIFVLFQTFCVFSFDKEGALASIWSKTIPKLEKVLSLLDEMRNLPDERLLGKDKENNAKKINNILSDVLEIISCSEAKEIRDNIIVLRSKIKQKEEKIREYQQKIVFAPEKDGFLVTTRQEYDKKIKELKSDVNRMNDEITERTNRLIVVLSDYGINASYDEIQGLLNSVTGYDIAGMYGAFDNVKSITNKLITLMEENENDIESQRKYYGIYALLLKTCAYMEASFIDKVESNYYPKLEDMYQQSQEVLSNAQKQLKSSADLSINQKKTLEHNIQSLNTHLQVIKRYQSYLKDQCQQIQRLRMHFESSYEVAYNTYRTLTLSSDLLALIRNSKKELDMLITLEVPEIIVFNNENLEREFKLISEQLQ